MLPFHTTLHYGVGKSGLQSKSLGHGLRARRPLRQPQLGVSAFKDWFAGLVQQHKEPQLQPQPAPQTTTATQEQLNPAQHLQQPQPKAAPKRDFLEARQVSLFQLFDSSDYKFDIPTYQRPYAWRTKQIYELLQDFVKAYESRQEYFLGAIVATRAADGANVPYQLIDGQQRLTSLVLLLAFLHGWARQQGNDVLEGRFRRMLYMEADPLEAGSNGRYRLRLRDADDKFFRNNVLDAFLPQQYHLTGLAAAAATAAAAVAVDTGSGAATAAAAMAAAAATEADGHLEASTPLENETWWRLYENASFLRNQLDKLVSEGLNLQDFAFHVLRNCFVVLMVARDEGASFRIFSTLNGRGMDLSAVDKLKADLLAGELTPAERDHFANAWSEMESVLGRASFHRVFDYMRELAVVRDPVVRETSVLEYFTRRVDDPSAVKQVLQVALDYARLLLQLRQASWAPPEMAALLAETPLLEHSHSQPPPQLQLQHTELSLDSSAAATAVSDVVHAMVLEQATTGSELHNQQRQWQHDGDGSSSNGIGNGAVAAVGELSYLVESSDNSPKNLDDGVLVFRFEEAAVAVDAPTAVTSSSAAAAEKDLLAAEESLRHDVLSEAEDVVQEPESAPLAPPPPTDAAAAATMTEAKVETADGADDELRRRQRQAILLAERSRHLNLFVDEAWMPPLLEFFYQTEDLELRAAFMKGAEALQLLLELLGDPAAKAARWGLVSEALLQRPFRPEAVLAALRLTDEEREQFRARLDSKDLYGTADQRTLRHLLVRCEPPSVCRSVTTLDGLLVEKMVPQTAPEGSGWRKTRISSPCDPQSAWPDPWFASATTAAAGTSASASSSSDQQLQPESGAVATATATAAVSYDVKYWYEVQRLHWHGKLGNLVLLPATVSSATSATADYDTKTALWRQAGVASRLPGFTGPLVDERGRYGRFRFCYDECRQRHTDMLEYLITEFELR